MQIIFKDVVAEICVFRWQKNFCILCLRGSINLLEGRWRASWRIYTFWHIPYFDAVWLCWVLSRVPISLSEKKLTSQLLHVLIVKWRKWLMKTWKKDDQETQRQMQCTQKWKHWMKEAIWSHFEKWDQLKKWSKWIWFRIFLGKWQKFWSLNETCAKWEVNLGWLIYIYIKTKFHLFCKDYATGVARKEKSRSNSNYPSPEL